MMISPSEMVERVENLLVSKSYNELVEEIFKPENLFLINTEGMDLITKICESGLAFAVDNDALSACSKCLMHVVQNYRPKESLICLLEQGEAFANSDKFTYILGPLQYVMLNLPKKREKTFSWVLSILKSHIKYFLQVPSELITKLCEGQEAFLLEQDPQVKAILQTYKDYIDFYTPFVEQLYYNARNVVDSQNQEEIESIQRQRAYLRDYLVDLLGLPLIHFNLDCRNESSQMIGSDTNRIGPKIKTDARIIAEKLMNLLSKVDLNPAHFFQYIEGRVAVSNDPVINTPPKTKDQGYSDDNTDEDEDEEEIVVHMSSIVSYFYLIFNQHINQEKMSSVLSPTYMFNTILNPVTTILKNTNNFLALKKALALGTNILSLCDKTMRPTNYDHRLHHELLETEIHRLFIDRLSYLSIYCQSQPVRLEAYKLLKNYMMTFDLQGKYEVINLIFNTIPNDSLVGHMITELKQFIFIASDSRHPSYEPNMEQQFLGSSAHRLILLICCLKDGATTDLCQNSNKIISALNMLRFLLIRDVVTKKKIGIIDLFPRLEEILLNPLRAGLNLSKAHYELKLKQLRDPHLQKQRESDEKQLFERMETALEIGGKELKPGDISLDEQKSAVISAINTFEHMEGLLAWVYEAHSQSSNATCNKSN